MNIAGNNHTLRENLVLVVLASASIEVYRRLRGQAARARKFSGEGRYSDNILKATKRSV